MGVESSCYKSATSKNQSKKVVDENEDYVLINNQFTIQQRRKIFFGQLKQLNVMVDQFFSQFDLISTKNKQKQIQEKVKRIKGTWNNINILFQLIKNTFPQIKKEQASKQNLSSYYKSWKDKDIGQLLLQLSKSILMIKNQYNELNHTLINILKSKNGKIQDNKFKNIQSRLPKNIQKWILIDSLLYCLYNQTEIKVLRLSNGKQFKIKQMNASFFTLVGNQQIYTTQDLENIKKTDNNKIKELTKEIADLNIKIQKMQNDFKQKLQKSQNQINLLKANIELQKQSKKQLQNKLMQLQMQKQELVNQIDQNLVEQGDEKNKIIESKEEKCKYNIEVNQGKQSIIEIKKNNIELAFENQLIKQQIQEYQRNKEKLEQEIEKIKNQNKQLLKQNNLITKIKQDINQKIKETQLNQKKLDHLNHQNQLFKKQQEQYLMIKSQLQDKVRKYQQKILNLNSRVSQMQCQIDQYKNQVKQKQSLKYDISIIAADNQLNKKQLNSYKLREKELIVDHQNLKKQYEINENQLNQFKYLNQTLAKQNENNQRIILQLQEKLLNFEEQGTRIRFENHEFDSRVSQMEYDINYFKKQAEDIKNQLNGYKEREMELIIQNQSFKQNQLNDNILRKLQDEIIQLKNQIQQLTENNSKTIEDNQKQLIYYKEKEMQLIVANKKLKEKQINENILRQMQDKINSLNSQIELLKYNIFNIIEDNKNELNNYKMRQLQLVTKNQQLKEQIKIKENKLTQMQYLSIQNLKFRQDLALISNSYKLETTIFPGSEIISTNQLKTIFLQSSQLMILSSKLIYRASEREFKEFHSVCKNKKNIIVIILAQNQNIFGGFTNIPFTSESNQSEIDQKQQSFLFRLKNKQFIKLKILEKKCPIIYDEKFGPIFGQSQIRIKDTHRTCFSNYGIQGGKYVKDPNITNYRAFFGGDSEFKIKEYEVYQIKFS